MNFKQNSLRYVVGVVIALFLVLLGSQYSSIKNGLGFMGESVGDMVASVIAVAKPAPTVVYPGKAAARPSTANLASGSNSNSGESGNNSSNSGEGEGDYLLTVSIKDQNAGISGVVTAKGINCGNDCAEYYKKGTSVNLVSVSNKTSHQIGWKVTTISNDGKKTVTSPDCPINTNTCKLSLVMSSDVDVVALFINNKNLKEYTLTIKTESNNNSIVGQVEVEPCMDDTWTKEGRIRTYTEGSKVTLSPSYPKNISFEGWSGACSGKGECVLIMDSNKVVTAKFKGLSILDRRRWGVSINPLGDKKLGLNCDW